jgi:hypothetical protein
MELSIWETRFFTASLVSIQNPSYSKENKLHLLKDGRAAFLEFLRNLTSQTVFLSIAFVVGSKLDFRRLDFSNIAVTIIFWVPILIWALAAWANSSLFIEKSLVAVERINRASRLLVYKHKKPRNLRLIQAALMYSWRNKKIFFAEVILVMVIVEFGLVAVVVLAVTSATSLLNLK